MRGHFRFFFSSLLSSIIKKVFFKSNVLVVDICWYTVITIIVILVFIIIVHGVSTKLPEGPKCVTFYFFCFKGQNQRRMNRSRSKRKRRNLVFWLRWGQERATISAWLNLQMLVAWRMKMRHLPSMMSHFQQQQQQQKRDWSWNETGAGNQRQQSNCRDYAGCLHENHSLQRSSFLSCGAFCPRSIYHDVQRFHVLSDIWSSGYHLQNHHFYLKKWQRKYRYMHFEGKNIYKILHNKHV